MPEVELLQHPVTQVSINGETTEKRAAQFRLATQSGFHAVVSSLLFPADAEVGSEGDAVEVSLVTGDREDLYFTGACYSARTHGKYRELLLTDSYKKLCDTAFAAAYRKEQAANIIDDILSAAGITDKAVTAPEVELARFSTQTLPCRQVLDLLVDALKSHGVSGLQFFFDARDAFHFGTADNTGKNEGDSYEFTSGKNILRKGSGLLEVLPAPIRHTQAITVDGASLVTTRTDLLVSGRSSRLTLYVKEAQ